MWRSANETFGMSPLSVEKYLAPSVGELFGATVVNVGRCHKSDARVSVLVVVVAEETAAEQSAVFGGTKTARKLRAVLQRLELGLGVGIVVRDVRSGVGLGNSEVRQEQSPFA